jgi:hypothetical protein
MNFIMQLIQNLSIHSRSLTAPIILLLLVCLNSARADITVTAQFNPTRIAMGDNAQYIVSITETSDRESPQSERITSLPIPQSDGLTLRNGRTSTSRQSNIINSKAEHSTIQQLIIDAIPPSVGSFTIPSYNITYKGKSFVVPAATLTVVERAAGASPALNELIFLKTDAPQELYLGQTTVLNLKLYVYEQVNYRGYDDFNRIADGFTVSDLPEPTESAEILNGRRYRVLIWPITLTPIQSGPQDLNFGFSVVAQVPTERNTRDPFGRNSPFGGSLFDNFFSRSERFNLYTEPTQIDVLPLPKVGQPANYSGAIGDFGMQVYADSETSAQDEPIMLSVKITGRGNFDRISGPNMPPSADWRSYEPEDIMESDASDALRGVKRFDYVFIPQKAGTLKLPEVSFSYYDPETSEYIELSTPPIKVEVTPSLIPQPTVAPQVKEEIPSTDIEPTIALSPEETLLTLDYRPKRSRSSGFSILKEPLFYGLNGLAFIALTATALALGKRRRLKTDDCFTIQQAAKKDLKRTLAAAKTAESANNIEDFYRHAQNAVRLAATRKTARNLRAANLPQLEAIFLELSLSEQSIEAARKLFSTADAHRFSGSKQAPELRAIREQLNLILKAL